MFSVRCSVDVLFSAGTAVHALHELVQSWWKWQWNFRRSCVKTRRISEVNRIVPDVRIEIDSRIEESRVFAQESSRLWVVVPLPEIVEIRLCVEFAARELKGIDQRATRRDLLAEGIESVGFR